MTGPYDDIICLARPPHPKDRPPMSLHDRAAQFAPFAALAGYSAMVAEKARATEAQWEAGDTDAPAAPDLG